MGSEGLLKHSGLSITAREMSTKRGYQNHGEECEAEDLSMPVRKRLKGSQPSINGIKGEQSRRDNLKHAQNNAGTMQSFAVEMDIKEPLTTLRSLVEERIGVKGLSSSVIFLQGKIKMNPNSSLGDQCIKSDGRAEIKIEVTVVLGGISRINIVDVLRLSHDEDDEDEIPEEECEDNSSVEDLSIKTNNNYNDGQLDDRSGSDTSSVSDSSASPRSSPFPWCILHDVASLFPMALPKDPLVWTSEHTQHWLRWALKEFNIKFIDDSMWSLTGKDLSQMSEEEFHQKVPLDPKNLFWTHTELLRKCQIFAVPDKAGQRTHVAISNETKAVKKVSPGSRKARPPAASTPTNGNVKRTALTGHNGQIQLWQFLLELLGDKKSKNVIQWVGREGEFKLNDPELVAQMWGQRKNKPKMNYEKLSRALRYYYSEAMIAKVHGRRFVYKFVCNLKELIGYSTEELINLVEDEEPTGFEVLD